MPAGGVSFYDAEISRRASDKKTNGQHAAPREETSAAKMAEAARNRVEKGTLYGRSAAPVAHGRRRRRRSTSIQKYESSKWLKAALWQPFMSSPLGAALLYRALSASVVTSWPWRLSTRRGEKEVAASSSPRAHQVTFRKREYLPAIVLIERLCSSVAS